MEEAATSNVEPLVAFSWLVSELLGRAVSSCIDYNNASTSLNPVCRKVTLELAQSPQREGQIMLKVSDEGHGLPDNLKSIQRIFTPLELPFASSCVSQDAGLMLRTTNLDEKTIRRYHACTTTTTAESSQAVKLQVVKVPVEEEKLPGMQISGTQGTLILSSVAVPPDAALTACQQLLSMLSTLCPPVHLVLKATGLVLNVDDQNSSIIHAQRLDEPELGSASSTITTATTTATALTPPATAATTTTNTTTFARQLEPLPSTLLLSPTLRLKTGLVEEFPPSSNSIQMPLQLSPSQLQPMSTPPLSLPLLSFVGVGQGAVPRGCKWNACAGVVLQLPDHEAIAKNQQQQLQHQMSSSEIVLEDISAPGAPLSSTPAYLFRSHAVQFAENANYIDALRRVNWAGHGFKLLTINSGGGGGNNSSGNFVEQPEASLEPVAVQLQCEQPESMANIAAIVVHLYCTNAEIDPRIDTSSSSSQQQQQQQQQKSKARQQFSLLPKPLPPLHQRTLIRSSIEAALLDLKQQCPRVISDRRERSLMKALPVVSTAVAGILNRSVGQGVLAEACQALQVRDVEEIAGALHRKLEEVVAFAQQQQQQQQQQQRDASGS